jgi:hypothetical protein
MAYPTTQARPNAYWARRRPADPKRTLHREGCRRVFGRYDADCARCQELASGAAARPGWITREQKDRAHAESIKRTFCFCPDTPLYVNRCDRCSKRPYTD